MLVRPQPREIIQPDRRLISPRRTRGALPGITRPAIMRARSAPPVVNTSLWTILQNRGLDANCKLCLDAADSASYSGSGQNFNDLSGTGTHFYRGETSGSEGTDPTFNGSAGGNSENEYFSSDGGDDFCCQLSLQTWMSNLHKDGAVATYLAVVYTVAASVASNCSFQTAGNRGLGDIGVIFHPYTTGGKVPALVPTLTVCNGGGSAFAREYQSGFAMVQGNWNFLAISLNEGTGAAAWSGNSTVAKNSGTDASITFTSPSASNANQTPRIWRQGSSGIYVASGARLAMLAVWEGVAISEANLNLIREDIKAMRPGYGLAA